MYDLTLPNLKSAVREVGDSFEFLRYDCDEDPDELGAHNPDLLAATKILQGFVTGALEVQPPPQRPVRVFP